MDEPLSMDGPASSSSSVTGLSTHRETDETDEADFENAEGGEDDGAGMGAAMKREDSSLGLQDQGFGTGGALRHSASQLQMAEEASDKRMLMALCTPKLLHARSGSGSGSPPARRAHPLLPHTPGQPQLVGAGTGGAGTGAGAGAGAGSAVVAHPTPEQTDSEPASVFDFASTVEPASVTLFNETLPLLRQAVKAVVDDSFNRCFESHPPERWNWGHLFIPYCVGVLMRYLVLFPVRLLILLLGVTALLVVFFCVKLLPLPQAFKFRMERKVIQMICGVFVLSWTGVIKVHGVRPVAAKGKSPGVFVANHSSMIDFIILQQSNCYAVVGQQHTGWVKFFQDFVLNSMQCVWFNRGESSNRQLVAQKLGEHARDGARIPLLVFPEGTCVNNEYVVQFKKGVFELGAPVCPIAIRYNKVFVDGYWNSRKMSFGMHLFRLMTSWCVVCDVWFLDPQVQREGEDAVQFAKRVQHLIARRAGIEAVDWDGYLKYWKPSDRFIQTRQAAIAASLLESFGLSQPAAPVPSASFEATGIRQRVGKAGRKLPGGAAPLLQRSLSSHQ